MTDPEEAVKAYEQALERRRQTATPRTLAATEVEWTADAAITALQQALAEAEDRVARQRKMMTPSYVMDLEAKLAASEERAQGLKCCGNCGHFDIRHDPYGECEQECDVYFPCEEYPLVSDWPGGSFAECEPYHPCHFTPSRWAERRTP